MNKKIAKYLSYLLVFALVFTNFFSIPVKVHAVAASDLFFSEYIEGSSYNKALEIYNGTGSTIDLSTYTIETYFNGSSTVGQTYTLGGNLANNSTFVIAHGSAVAAIKDKANVTLSATSSVVAFNGDDAVVLKHNGTIIDVIGQVGTDPGTSWGTAPAVTVDCTLVRKPAITAGDAVAGDAFDPAVEWIAYPKDTADYLGSHTIAVDEEAPAITHTPVTTAISGNPISITATITDASGVGEVKLYYGSALDNMISFLTMDNVGGNTYTGQIPAQSVGDLYYYIQATDSKGNTGTNPADKANSYKITITEADTTPPVVAHTAVKNAFENIEIDISAAIADDSAMTAEVYYGTTLDGNAFTNKVSMTNGEGNTYSAKIPGQAAGDIYYYIKAVDANNNTTTNPTDIAASNKITVNSVSSIADARQQAAGTKATVSGIVTWIETISSSPMVYIQDDTAAIAISYLNATNKPAFNIGDRATVTGTLGNYNQLMTIASTAEDTLKGTSGNPLPTPKVIAVAQANSEAYEAQLVAISKATLGTIDTSKNTPLTDSSGSINIYKIPALTGIVAGDVVDVVAIASQYSSSSATSGYQLRVRQADDVSTTPDTSAPVIEHTPVTEGNTNLNLIISANIKEDRRLTYQTVFYRTIGQTEYKTIAMNNIASNIYTANIPKADLSTAGLEYYIETSDGTHVVTMPADKAAPYQVTVTANDIVGPEVTNMLPANGSSVGDIFKPVISADYSDASEVDTATVKLYLNDIDKTANAVITASGITYTPATDLERGSYTVKLVAKDTKGNKTDATWTFSVGAPLYNFYFGQLHAHTNYSDGQGTPEVAYAWARDNGDADFFALTDHSNSFDNDTASGNITDVSQSTSDKWKQLHQIADDFNKDGKFVAIAGYEMTWSGSTGGWGHINTFNTPWFESRNNSKMDLKAYYNKIAQDTDSISQLNHPGKTFGDFADFGFYSKAADDVVDLVEVGNGEGAVRGSGYFPSYEYYTRALDKGWHVAPTNNQDNHKAGWVTANTARDVALAESLTRDSIYDAFRNRRVYSTEDSNLRITYMANGKPMGTILGATDKLDITITFNDPDATDKIQKVSIISNGGVVAASKTFDSSTGTWQLQLDPQYDYYYVRIDEADKDIAVTAPVWVGEVVPVGISKVSVSQNPTITGTPIKVSAGIYNNSGAPLTNVNVEFYKNEVLDANKIGQATIASVAASASGTATIDWIPDTAGSIKLIAKTTINYNSMDKVFTESTSVDVANPGDLTKVVVDASHYNQYISGDYAGKILTLKSMLAAKKFMVVENKAEITADVLSGAKLLILTDPQSKDQNNLYKSKYSDAEVAAIKNFVDNGGALIITSRADYGDTTESDYQTSAQGNKVLQAIGSRLRFNDDEVIDKTTNGGQEYRLAFNDYTSSKYYLTNIGDGSQYSFFSGCSVIAANSADTSTVDILVKGHKTTETLDSDLQADNTPVGKGQVNAIAAEILSSGGKVVVAGTTFFSDFELTGDNLNSNKQITENIINWMTTKKATIADVRIDADKDGKPDNLGKRFTVEGTVTAQSTAVGTNNAFFDVIYVQDGTAGITVFGISTKKIPLGTKVKIYGTVDQYEGDAELQIDNEDDDIIMIDSNPAPVEPQTMTTADSMLESNEGWLVKVQGKVTQVTENALYINDGTGEAKVYVNGYIGDGTDNADMLGKWNPNIEVGDTISAIGLASEDAAGHRIRVRNTAEIVRFPLPVASIQLNQPQATIEAHRTFQLTATVLPTHADNKTITWSSSNPQVASVDQTGLVVAYVPGTTVITAAAQDGSGVKATCTITVIKPQYEENNTGNNQDNNNNNNSNDNNNNNNQNNSTNVYEVPQDAVKTEQTGTTAQVTVDANAVVAAANQAAQNADNKKEEVIAITATVSDAAQQINIGIDANIVSALAKNEQALEINVGGTTLQMSSQVMEKMPVGEDVKLVIRPITGSEEIKDAKIPAELKFSGSGVAFEFVGSDNKDIKADGGIKIQLKVEPGTDKNLIGIYYYNEETGELQFIGGKINGEMIEAYTTHNSKYVVMEYKKTFADVNAAYKNFVEAMAAKHVITGYADGTYKGDNTITRAEAAILICRVLGVQPTAYKGIFKDVAATDYTANYIQTVYDLKLMNGKGYGQFAPKGTITREEMFVIIGRILKNVKGADASKLTAYADYSTLSTWAKDATANAIAANIITAKDNKLEPKRSLTRYEAAEMMFKIFNYNQQ